MDGILMTAASATVVDSVIVKRDRGSNDIE
jgi:hypothetical protein